MAGSGPLFQVVSYLLIVLYATHTDMSTPQNLKFKLRLKGSPKNEALRSISAAGRFCVLDGSTNLPAPVDPVEQGQQEQAQQAVQPQHQGDGPYHPVPKLVEVEETQGGGQL